MFAVVAVALVKLIVLRQHPLHGFTPGTEGADMADLGSL
jgi:hypothetical protein